MALQNCLLEVIEVESKEFFWVAKFANELLLLLFPGGVCGDDGAPKLVAGGGGVEGVLPRVAKLEKELLLLFPVGVTGGGGVDGVFPPVAKPEKELLLLFPVGMDGEEGGAPKLLLWLFVLAGVDGVPKFEAGADCCCCLAK